MRRGRLGDVTTASAWAPTAAPPAWFIVTSRAEASVAGAFDAVEQATFWPLNVVEWVPLAPSAAGWHDCQANWLAFCVRPVEFVYRGSRVTKTLVGDESDAFGSPSSVIDKG